MHGRRASPKPGPVSYAGAGRVAVNTATSMMNERSRAHHTCVDTTRSVALLTQQYGTTGWRSMRAVRLAPSPLTAYASPLENSLTVVLRNRC
jgi:hypothetical protein